MGDKRETAYLAGGCGWIMQQLLRQPDGVVSTRYGFMGGEGENPTEEDSGGHAETVEVIFDPNRLPYRTLLELFFISHRADLDEDVLGSLYRSEIFYTSREQQTAAQEMILDVDAAGHWLGPTKTKVSEAGTFWEGPPGEQDVLKRFPNPAAQPIPPRAN